MQKHQILGLPAEAFEALREMCRTAKNLSNVGLFNLRQEFFATGQPLTYEANCNGTAVGQFKSPGKLR